MNLRMPLLTIVVGLTCLNGVAKSQAPHPWRPPFGLDRVGKAEHPPGIEADAVAFPMVVQNPVDKDCVEPLMDKELRYGRVQIVESTASRVGGRLSHVRWTYQSCDFNYKV